MVESSLSTGFYLPGSDRHSCFPAQDSCAGKATPAPGSNFCAWRHLSESLHFAGLGGKKLPLVSLKPKTSNLKKTGSASRRRTPAPGVLPGKTDLGIHACIWLVLMTAHKHAQAHTRPNLPTHLLRTEYQLSHVHRVHGSAMLQKKRRAPPSSAHHPARPRVFLNRILAYHTSDEESSPSKARTIFRRPQPPNIENPSESDEFDDAVSAGGREDSASGREEWREDSDGERADSASGCADWREDSDGEREDSVSGREDWREDSDGERDDSASERVDRRENSDGEREDSASGRGSGSDAGREDSADSAENITIGGGGESVDDGSGSDAGREDSDDSAEKNEYRRSLGTCARSRCRRPCGQYREPEEKKDGGRRLQFAV